MNKRMILLPCLFLAVAVTVRAEENPALAVIKKAIESHGGMEAMAKTRTASTSGSGVMTVNNIDIEFNAKSIFNGAEKFKLEMNAQVAGLKLNAIQILNGKKVKVKTTLGGAEQKVDDKVKEETIQAGLLQDVTTLIPLVQGDKYTLKLEKTAEIDGKPAAVVAVSGNGLREVKLFFDQATGRLVKTQRKGISSGPNGPVEVNEETTLSDFKPVDKAILPMKSVVTHDRKKFMTLTITEWKLLDKVDDSEFKVDD